MQAPKILMVACVDSIHSLRPLNWLLNRGCQVVFLSHFNPYPCGQKGFTFIPFPKTRGRRLFPKLLGKKIGVWLFRLSELTTALRLKMLWWRICPTLVHIHWVGDWAYYCVKAGIHPLVLSVWGSDINNHFLTNADYSSRSRVGETLAGADLILIDSADMHKKCAKLAGRDVPTELFSLGINTHRFRPGYAEAALDWRRKLNIPMGATVMLSARGWSPLYRHESILKAFAKALPWFNSEAFLVFKIFVLASTDRSLYERNMRQLAEKLNVAHRVRWMEAVPIDQLPEIYSFADVILNYPSMDAFPVTFFEAAACECPVISCRLPAYTRTFAEEYYHLVSSDNLSELSDALVEFVNGDRIELHRRLADLRQVIHREYDDVIVSARLLDVYQMISSQR